VYRQPRSGFTRIPYVQQCALRVEDREIEALLCNLSLLGAFLHAEPELSPGTPVRLLFSLPDGEAAIDAAAIVTWINRREPDDSAGLPAGFGLRFTALAAGEIRRIAALVGAFHAEPRPLLSRPEPQTEKLRIPFVAPCVVATAGGVARGNVCNLSAQGVYVHAEPIPESGDSVILSFRLPGLAEAFERAAVVTWRNPEGPSRVRALPPGFGLRFANLSTTDRSRLRQLVDEYARLLPHSVA